jgi:hypothetical protein
VKIMMNDRTIAVLIEDLPSDEARWATFSIADQNPDGVSGVVEIPDGFYPEGTFEGREGWRDVPEVGGEPLDMAVRELVRVRLSERARLLLTRT